MTCSLLPQVPAREIEPGDWLLDHPFNGAPVTMVAVKGERVFVRFSDVAVWQMAASRPVKVARCYGWQATETAAA